MVIGVSDIFKIIKLHQRHATNGQYVPSRKFRICRENKPRFDTTIDRRYIMEETAESVKEEVESLLNKVKGERDSFEYKIKELNRVIPSMTNRDAPIVRSVSKSIKNVLDKEPNYVASPGSYDQKHIDRIGTLKNCIAYGPGILELAHQPDEYIEIEDMVDSTKIMGNTLIDLLIS